jgi:hypothetical protein
VREWGYRIHDCRTRVCRTVQECTGQEGVQDAGLEQDCTRQHKTELYSTGQKKEQKKEQKKVRFVLEVVEKIQSSFW